ncbi:hypothetical protein BIFBRE_03075 [Bifidobacterium breve DSM 20213 = JCM 1192]|uniref:Uncharacterized protein n=1 Tax=Bifidobacterium breve DSM 20213 = JCM 1192 TaxID=518634 RepID=D4BLY8_BIFBR|nr:hypothetical protein BIFBRE_03075 [Bifidobacterium breve DSM 20213 = JCM 1192]
MAQHKTTLSPTSSSSSRQRERDHKQRKDTITLWPAPRFW